MFPFNAILFTSYSKIIVNCCLSVCCAINNDCSKVFVLCSCVCVWSTLYVWCVQCTVCMHFEKVFNLLENRFPSINAISFTLSSLTLFGWCLTVLLTRQCLAYERIFVSISISYVNTIVMMHWMRNAIGIQAEINKH